MWTRTYLLLLVVRIYFALSPSYIHPDENFQGPEVIAGRFWTALPTFWYIGKDPGPCGDDRPHAVHKSGLA